MIDFYNYNLDEEIEKIKNTEYKSSDIDWYSSRKIIHELYDIPKSFNIEAYPFHGINITDYELKDYALLQNCPTLCTRQSQVEHLLGKGGDKNKIFASGALFPLYRRLKDIKQDKDAKGTIAFLTHSSMLINKKINIKAYIEKLNSLPDKFKPVNICMYWVDILNGKYKEFIDAGFNVYTAGHSNNRDFVDNFYEIIRHHKFATTNLTEGSNLLYTIEFGLPTFFYGQEESEVIEEEASQFKSSGFNSINDIPTEYKKVHNDFFVANIPTYPNIEISKEGKLAIKKVLGLDYQTPQKIVRRAIISYAKQQIRIAQMINLKKMFFEKQANGNRRTIRLLHFIKISYRKKNAEIKPFTNYNNIEDLGADKNFYYGEIAQDDFISILNKISDENYSPSKAIEEYCMEKGNNYFLEHAIGNKRGLAIELFDDLKDKKVLDYGCGLGSIGIAAAKKGASVTFVESCWARLQMTQYLTSEQNDITNHKFLACDSINEIEEYGEKYDLIVVNGLLEWLPSTTNQSHEQALQSQLNFLKTCKNMLTENGVIFLAMENRFSFLYQIGYPEDHTEIDKISWVDRNVGNKMHQELKNTDYVNFTWSYDDYFENSAKIGLNVKQINGMFPDYRFPEKIIDLNNVSNDTLVETMHLEEKIHPEVIKYNEYIDFLAKSNVCKKFVYSYGVILGKNNNVE